MSATTNNKLIYYRLVALWVLCEAMLGGIIHGFKIPVSGLIVGLSAIVCICLIAWYAPGKGMIIKATLIVAIFKMMLSPQAPPPAYFAVFFQGLLGELLFRSGRRYFGLSCIVLAVLGLLESGLQRILVLTIVYGNSFWKVINDFINGLTKQKHSTNYSLLIGAAYVLLHFVAGILAGIWASALPRRISKWSSNSSYELHAPAGLAMTLTAKTRGRKKIRTVLLITWILLIGLYIQSYFRIGEPLLPPHISLKVLLRSLIIVLGWIFIIGPLSKQLLHRWLKKKQAGTRPDVELVLSLLPSTQQLVSQSWKQSAGRRGWSRVNTFIKIILVNAVGVTAKDQIKRQVYILTAPIQSGKTTSLVEWTVKRKDSYGILTPVLNGKRVFMDSHTREQFPMEATGDDTETVCIGRFVFSKRMFERANSIIRQAIDQKGWLIIDEIGPMELGGDGFAETLKVVLAKRTEPLLLVVRQGMAANVNTMFGIDATIIDHVDNLPRNI